MPRWNSPRSTGQPIDDTALRQEFSAACHQVEGARDALESLLRQGHDAAHARAAAHQVTVTLTQAMNLATHALRAFQETAPAPHRRSWHRWKATLQVPEPERWWSAQLVRLSEISEWLSETVRDGLELDVPTTVQVGSRAANGPHIPGMEADPADLVAATLHRPWIGVPLMDIVDRVTASQAALTTAGAPES